MNALLALVMPLLLIVSFFGLGLVWQSVLRTTSPNGNHLTLSIGLSLYLFLGGLLSYFRLANSQFTLSILLLGFFCFLRRVIKDQPRLNFYALKLKK
jgi:Na+/proline symporter